MMTDEGDDKGEADLIIAKLRKKRSNGGDDGGSDEESGEGSASSEAATTAVEDIGRILAKRDLKETEVSDLEDALRRFVQNCEE
jgi:hypothetical protein